MNIAEFIKNQYFFLTDKVSIDSIQNLERVLQKVEGKEFKLIPYMVGQQLFNAYAVLDLICQMEGLATEDVKAKNRKRELVEVRFIAAAIIRNKFKHSYIEIGKILGGRDHSSIMHAIASCEDLRHMYKNFNDRYLRIEQAINQITTPTI